MGNNINIPVNGKIRVYWDDKPENYTKEGRSRVKSYFANKYGVIKDKINVVFRPIKTGKNGELIRIGDSGIDNIMDITYQRELFKEWLKREEVSINFKHIINLDEKVNAAMDFEEVGTKHLRWSMNWLVVNNFLSFGNNEPIYYNKLNGLTVINSIPENQGGKTVFTIDALKFLFFGSTTKTDKNEEIFNTYSNENVVLVRGSIRIEDIDYLINRKIVRTPKRSGEGYTYRGSVIYSELTPDGEEIELKGEDGIKTTKKIEETIGSESDFELMVLATSDNLTDLINSKATERGKLLTKFIGLDPIEKKEKMVRELYNKFAKTMTANHYDITTLNTEIDELNDNSTALDKLNKGLDDGISAVNGEKETHNTLRDKLLSSKHNIDAKILSVDPIELQKEIDGLIAEGISAKTLIDEGDIEIKKIENIEYDEELDFTLTTEKNKLLVDIGKSNGDIKRLTDLNTQLKDSEFCPMCKQALKDVDHTDSINENKIQITKETKIRETKEGRLTVVNTELEAMSENKTTVNKRDKLELTRDRLEVKQGQLRNDIKAKKTTLKEYNLNLSVIESNKQIEASITWEDTELAKLKVKGDSLSDQLVDNQNTIINNNKSVTDKKELIDKITKEDKIEKVYKIYIDMVGKKGISKLILRSVLPIINSELHRLLSETCNFDVELNINDKNDVEFNITLDKVTRSLKSGSGFEKTASAIALRAVLGRITTLPTPNFISFDEVFGKVADINLDSVELLFKKMGEMYDNIFIITHNKIVRDWGNNILTVIKTDNISNLKGN